MKKMKEEKEKTAGFSILPLKKFGKDKFVILVLVGILFFIIAIPVDSHKNRDDVSQEQSGGNVSEAERNSQGVGTKNAAQDITQGTTQDAYVAQLEQRLAEAIAYVDGVGRVKVMITLKTSEEKVVEKDMPSSRSNTSETDAEGGRRSIYDMESGESTVYITEGNGIQTPYVIKSIEPRIEGVVVIAQGGGNAQVNRDITEAVQALFNIEAHKVKVLKMKRDSSGQ